MESIQIAIVDPQYRAALRDMLIRNGAWIVQCVDTPDPLTGGVLVVDAESLERLPLPIIHPERVVLITQNEPSHLARAWDAGLNSVVFDKDPLSTAVLAIMAARLRVSKTQAEQRRD
jgi:hypothetical protein